MLESRNTACDIIAKMMSCEVGLKWTLKNMSLFLFPLPEENGDENHGAMARAPAGPIASNQVR